MSVIRENSLIGKPLHYFDGDEDMCHPAIVNGPLEVEAYTTGDYPIGPVDLVRIDTGESLTGVALDWDALTSPSYHPMFGATCPRG